MEVKERPSGYWNEEISKRGRIVQPIIGLLLLVSMLYLFIWVLNLPNDNFDQFMGKYMIEFPILMAAFIGYVLIISIFNFFNKKVQIGFVIFTTFMLGIVIGNSPLIVVKAVGVLLFGLGGAVITVVFMRAIVTGMTFIISIGISLFLSLVVYAIIIAQGYTINFEVVLYIAFLILFFLYRVFGRKLNKLIIRKAFKYDLDISQAHFKFHLRVIGVVLYITTTIVGLTIVNHSAVDMINES